MTEPVMVIQTALFTRDYNYRVVYVLTASLQNIIHIYYSGFPKETPELKFRLRFFFFVQPQFAIL